MKSTTSVTYDVEIHYVHTYGNYWVAITPEFTDFTLASKHFEDRCKVNKMKAEENVNLPENLKHKLYEYRLIKIKTTRTIVDSQ